MKISANQLKSLESPYLKYVHGDLHQEALAPKPPENWSPGHLVFVSTKDDLEKFMDLQAPLIVSLEKLVSSAPRSSGSTLFSTPSISAALAVVLPFFDRKVERFPKGIHPSAVIDPSAEIGESVSIGALSYIGPKVKVGKGSKIGPQVTVELEAKIGENSILHAQVFIGAHCEVGNHCEIHPHTTIGSDGFGYVTGPDKKHYKVPQIGKVVLEDHVEIGSNCAIDRATLFETRIGQGTKFDNIIHVAHNVRFGKNNLITAGFNIAGSSVLGDNCIAAGGAGVVDHVRITDNVILGARASVTKDITEPGAYIGYPLEKMKDGLKTIASLPALPKLRKQMLEVRKKLGLNADE
jgi:UDP-3-O-[3-hydroxymyristoyl] glucosamine N-acyltransferase